MFWKRMITAGFSMLVLLATPIVTNAQNLNQSQTDEIALSDAVFTMMGSLSSYINSNPAYAVEAIGLESKLMEYSAGFGEQPVNGNGNQHGEARYRQRLKQQENGLKRWTESIELFKKGSERALDGALKRIESQAANLAKAKRPRPATYFSIAKTSVKQAESTIKVLQALNSATDEQIARFETAMKTHQEIIEKFPQEYAKSGRVPRDGYREANRTDIESQVATAWKSMGQTAEIEKVILPSNSWKTLYGARWNEDQQRLVVMDIERLQTLVVTRKSEEVRQLTPVWLERDRKVKGPALLSPSLDKPFDVLASKIK